MNEVNDSKVMGKDWESVVNWIANDKFKTTDPDEVCVDEETKLWAYVYSYIRWKDQSIGRKTEDPPDRVCQSVNGTICFEWFKPDEYIEIEFTGKEIEGRSIHKNDFI